MSARSGGTIARTLGRGARRVPFTLGLAALIVACALGSGAWRRSLAGSDLLATVGYGWPALRAGRLWTFVAGVPFALYPWMFLTILWIVAIFVAPYEYLAGTARAALVFAGAHLAAALGAALLVAALAAAGGPAWLAAMAEELDVGASAGAYGCVAALTLLLPRRARLAAVVALLLFLAGQLALSRRIWDIEHLLAVPLGLGLGLASRRWGGRDGGVR